MNSGLLGCALSGLAFSIDTVNSLLSRHGKEPSGAVFAIAWMGLVISVVVSGLIGLQLGADRCTSSILCLEPFAGLALGGLVGYIAAAAATFICSAKPTAMGSTPDRDRQTPLTVAISLAKDGEIAAARHHLHRVIEQDPENELAWFWLSRCAESRADLIHALERVLEINPQNLEARDALKTIKMDYPHTERQHRSRQRTAPQSRTHFRSPLDGLLWGDLP